MIHVLATVTVAPGTRAQFLEVFNANVPAVHAEDGCIEYGAAIDTPTDMAVQAPFRPDVAAPHMLAFRVKAKDWIQSTSLQILDPA